MHIPKGYFHDKIVVLLLSINAFLVLLGTVLVLLRLDGGSEVYIVEYRANLGLSAFKRGGPETLYSFVIFGLIIFALHTLISIRVYPIRRQFAVAVLAMGSLLLMLSIVVSNALLILR
jgi:hypothetical protein